MPRRPYIVPVNGGRYQFNRAIQLAGFNPTDPLPEDEEAREAALLEAEDTKRVQRRRVRELNKLVESATDERREFIREMLSATKPPKNAATWTAMMLALTTHTSCRSSTLLSDLLPELMDEKAWATYEAKKKIAAAATAASESRAWMLTFALTVAPMESRMAKDARRSPAVRERVPGDAHRERAHPDQCGEGDQRRAAARGHRQHQARTSHYRRRGHLP